MADIVIGQTQDRIDKDGYLLQFQKESANAADTSKVASILKHLRINKHLTPLKEKKAVAGSNATGSRKRRFSQTQAGKSLTKTHVQPASDALSVRDKVLKYVLEQKRPVAAIEIAKGIGLRSKKEVNPTLYRLKRDKHLQCSDNQHSKPFWTVSKEAAIMDKEELFRDSSTDSDAPGAYSPEKNKSGPGIHPEKQHNRYKQRIVKPYDTPAHAQRHRHTSGGGQNTSLASSTLVKSTVKQVDSGIVSDIEVSSASKGAEKASERLLVTVQSGDDKRNVSMTNSECSESSSHKSDAVASRVEDNGDESIDADEDGDDYFEEESGHVMSSRFKDMLGDLMFSDLTYIEDEEMPPEDEDMMSPDVIILTKISSEPDHTISTHKLAEGLRKKEEEILHVLGNCGDKVQVIGDQWSLTNKGKAWVKENLVLYPYLALELNSHDFSRDISLSQSQMLALPSSNRGLPPTPKELIDCNPVFSRSPLSGDSRQDFEGSNMLQKKSPSSRGRGRGLGWGCMLPAKDEVSKFGQSYEKGATLEGHASKSIPPPPPSALVQSSSSVGTSGSVEGGHQSGDQIYHRNIAGWQPSVRFNQISQLPSEMTASHSFSQQSHHFVRFHSVHSHGIKPELHKFTQEGLRVIPPSSIRPNLVRTTTPTVSSSAIGNQLSQKPPPTPLDIIHREMGKTTLITQSSGFPETETGLHVSEPHSFDGYGFQSQPLISSSSNGLVSMPATTDSSNSLLKITSESFAALNKNPISALMEYAQSRRMQATIEVVSQKGPSHRPVFSMAARVGNRQFGGVTCSNKKDGRKEAADLALRTLIAEGQYSAVTPDPSINIAPEDMTHFDKIAALTHQTFNRLIARIPENLAGRKVIAGLVMKCSNDDVGVVIGIGTGNRCITGDKLSLEGNTVNDSHAEIITRRCFLRFLYQQLKTYNPGKPHDLFEAGSGKKLRVKPGITFHLYISTAPCGDGALFSPRDVKSNSAVQSEVEKREHQPTFTSNVQGLLRTKMEGGEGTIPVDTKQVTIQTWDGVVRGERLRTMSCTDKICRWNVVGLQGALLSHFLEPIYLDSLTLGFLYDHGHLSRAVCCRLAREEPQLDSTLPRGYSLNHPWLGRVTACQPLRETQKTKAFTINWTLGDEKPEVLDGTLGHCHTGVEKNIFSRLAKRCMYESFKEVAKHLGRNDLLQGATYHQSKEAAKDFQAAKSAVIAKFQQLGCGWVKKPVEEEMFS